MANSPVSQGLAQAQHTASTPETGTKQEGVNECMGGTKEQMHEWMGAWTDGWGPTGQADGWMDG